VRKSKRNVWSVGAGYSQQYLSGLDRGKRYPTSVTHYEPAQALGVSDGDLIKPDGTERLASDT
jgi:hypothetical protein